MLIVVAGREGAGSTVLIPSAGGVEGPGRLGKALALSIKLNGRPQGAPTGLWFEKGTKPRPILATPRIGIDFAGPKWAGHKLRFLADLSKAAPRTRERPAQREI